MANSYADAYRAGTQAKQKAKQAWMNHDATGGLKTQGPSEESRKRWSQSASKAGSESSAKSGAYNSLSPAQQLQKYGNATINDTTYTTKQLAKEGRLPFEGALDTQLGKTLEQNILSSLAGQKSNQLIQAQSTGNEALARKAQDIRGMAAQNTIQSGNLGQGSAGRARMGAEMDIMRNLGDFQGKIAEVGAQEQAGARAQALQMLGLRGQQDQIAELKRSNLAAEAQQDELDRANHLEFLIRDSVDPGTKQALTDKAVEELLGAPISGKYVEQNEAFQADLEEGNRISNLVQAGDFGTLKNYTQKADGTWWKDGKQVGEVASEQLSSWSATRGQEMKNPDWINSNSSNISDQEWRNVATSLSDSELLSLDKGALTNFVDSGAMYGNPNARKSQTSEQFIDSKFSLQSIKNAGLKQGDPIVVGGKVYFLGGYHHKQVRNNRNGKMTETQYLDLTDENGNVIGFATADSREQLETRYLTPSNKPSNGEAW